MQTGKLGELKNSCVRYLDQRTYHAARPDWNPGAISSSAFLSRRLESSNNLYRKDLYAHYGCVNAIEFSAEGDLLVSGGDDRRVLLWNINGILSESRRPQAMKGEHNSNIFCLSFDSCNSKIFSAGNDEQVIVHDLKTGDLVDVFLHREAVYGVSVNPSLDSVFASAGEDGQVLMYDMREAPVLDPICLARYHDAFHSVQFHPIEPNFIVTANSREGVSLWDIRKPKVPVLRYGEKRCAQSSMCARFNRMGTQIVALRRRLPPILYDTKQSKPICEFDAEHYYNSCTMKSCCFAGENDQYILSGSDDFNLYMWKIPESSSSDFFVSDAHMVLKGHRSIVNQVRFNPQNFIIASSGVEKIVKLWSGISLPGSKGNLSARACENIMSRRVYTHDEYIGLVMESGQVFGDVNHDYSHGSTKEDPRMMAFFDSLVQREVEGWTSNTDLSDDSLYHYHPEFVALDDTETTRSSAVTSHSDDNNSGDGSVHDQRDNRRNVHDQGGDRANHHSAPGMADTSGRRRLPDEDGNDDGNDDDDDDANKVSSGSDWIMHLIAKKRAQLRAAKLARKKRKHLRRHRKKTQKFLRSYTTSRRRYLYHPEGQRITEESQANGDSQRLTATLADDINLRRHSYRRYIAPYTIMVVDSEIDSDDGDLNNASDSDAETSAAQQSTRETNNETNRKRPLWSPGSDSSSDDNPKSPKRTHLDFIHSDSEVDNDDSHTTKNGHIISEIVDSNGSDSEIEISRNSASLPEVESFSVSEEMNNQCDALSSVIRPTISNSDLGNDNASVGELENDLNMNSTENSAMPISSISIDDNGSLLFDTNHHSLISALELQNHVDVLPSSNTIDKIVQNGSSDRGTETTSFNGEENGFHEIAQNSEKNSPEPDDINCVESSENINGTESTGSNRKVSFTFKKRLHYCNLRNYRKHDDDDL